MGKRVVIIASGRTEQRALPHLLEHLRGENINVLEVRIPPRHRAITLDAAERLVRAVWWDLRGRGRPPDKIVVLLDADGKDTAQVIEKLGVPLAARVSGLPLPVVTTAAQWHLEAWFFADPARLRAWVGKDLGSVDPSEPDAIVNPKLHLRNLIGRPYTANDAEEIARLVDVAQVRSSPSFRSFEAAVRNGRRSDGP